MRINWAHEVVQDVEQWTSTLKPLWCRGEPQDPAALKGMLHVGGPSLSLCRKTIFNKLNFHNNVLIYALQWLLGSFFILKYWSQSCDIGRQRESLQRQTSDDTIDCLHNTKVAELNSVNGSINWCQGIWQQFQTAFPAVKGCKHQLQELL